MTTIKAGRSPGKGTDVALAEIRELIRLQNDLANDGLSISDEIKFKALREKYMGWDIPRFLLWALDARLRVLAEFYEPHDDCKDSGFSCDYRRTEDCDICPCAIQAQSREDNDGR